MVVEEYLATGRRRQLVVVMHLTEPNRTEPYKHLGETTIRIQERAPADQATTKCNAACYKTFY